MTLPYNISEIANASNLVLQMQVINGWGDGLLFLPIYFGISILLIIGIKTQQPIEVALATGGFMSAMVGILMFILGLVPVWSPIFFATLAVIGIILILTRGVEQ